MAQGWVLRPVVAQGCKSQCRSEAGTYSRAQSPLDRAFSLSQWGMSVGAQLHNCGKEGRGLVLAEHAMGDAALVCAAALGHGHDAMRHEG